MTIDDIPDETEGVAPWMRRLHFRLREADIPSPHQTHWLRARWEAGLTVEQTLAILQLLHSGGSPLEADTHTRLADRRDPYGLQILECSCGVEAMANAFSRDEAKAWWLSHLTDTGHADPHDV